VDEHSGLSLLSTNWATGRSLACRKLGVGLLVVTIWL